MADQKEASESHWSVDRRVPLATLLALVIQTGGMVWWAATLQSTVDVHSKVIEDFRVNGTPGVRYEMATLKQKTTNLDERLDRIETSLDKLNDKLERLLDDRRDRRK